MAIARMWYWPGDGGYVAFQTREGVVYRLSSRLFPAVRGLAAREPADPSLVQRFDAGGTAWGAVGVDNARPRSDGTLWLSPVSGPLRLELTAVESATLAALIELRL